MSAPPIDSRAPGGLAAGRSHPQPELGPPSATGSLRARRAPLAEPAAQLARLEALDLAAAPHSGSILAALAAAGQGDGLAPARLEIFQVNLGKLCNMLCRHCHVDAGPDRTDAVMDRATVDDCLAALERSGATTLDLTGGAPELNPSFRFLVDRAAERGVQVIDRCNLTVLLTPGAADLPAFLAERGVEVVASLPNPRQRSTDAQRGDGAFAKSIAALALLTRHGYGAGDPRRRLTLVANPTGALLPASQASLEREWRTTLERDHGVRFDRLIALTNMPIARFLAWLEASGNLERYMGLLVASFNPATVAGLMCRSTLSVAWDGRVYDCDFNQMLELPAAVGERPATHIRDLDFDEWAARRVVTARHCFGCTAGAGSSCGGATAP